MTRGVRPRSTGPPPSPRLDSERPVRMRHAMARDRRHGGEMKSLHNPEHHQAIVDRLEALTPDADRKWGRMSAGGMLCHLSDAFRMVLGETTPPPCAEAARAHDHALDRDEHAGSVAEGHSYGCSLRPGEGRHAADRLRPGPGLTPAPHRSIPGRRRRRPSVPPAVRKMSTAEWGRWGYRHIDHHLRQFGA